MKSTKINPELDAQIRDEVNQLKSRLTSRHDLSREVAGLLFFRFGVYPSIQLVRGYTQVGSLTDVGKDIDAFWETIRQKSRSRIVGVDLPPELLENATEMLTGIWDAAQEIARGHLESLRQEVEGLRMQAQAEVQSAKEEAQEAIAKAQAMETASQNADAKREESERLLAVAHKEIEQITLRATKAEAREQALIADRAQAEQQFANSLQQEREARQHTEERLEGEVRFAKLGIEHAREEARSLDLRLKAFTEDRHLVETQLRRSLSERTQQVMEMQAELGELRGGLAAIKQERDRLAATANELMSRLQDRATETTRKLLEQRRRDLKAGLVTKPAAFEIAELFEAQLTFAPNADDADAELLYLASSESSDDAEPITPQFPNLEELEEFCAENLERYIARIEQPPEIQGQQPPWFWNANRSR